MYGLDSFCWNAGTGKMFGLCFASVVSKGLPVVGPGAKRQGQAMLHHTLLMASIATAGTVRFCDLGNFVRKVVHTFINPKKSPTCYMVHINM